MMPLYMTYIIEQALAEGFSFAHLAWHCFIVACCIIVTGIFSVADFISGVYTAKKLGEPLRSHRYRKTFEKMAVFWGFQLLVALVGLILTVMPFYQLPYLSLLTALVICWIEGRSMFEHAQRRRDHLAKIPQMMHDIVGLIGDDTVREIIVEIIKKKSRPCDENNP